MEHAGSNRVRVDNTGSDREVVAKEIQAQLSAAWEGAVRMDYAAVKTHFDGFEVSPKGKGRIQASHEEGNGVRNPLAPPTLLCVD